MTAEWLFRLAQQPDTLIVANGFNRNAALLGQLTDGQFRSLLMKSPLASIDDFVVVENNKDSITVVE